MTLADLPPDQPARIVAVDSNGIGVLRLMILGLVEGTPIRFVQAAIGGDPIEVDVMGASVSLRRDQARFFEVALEPAGD